MDEIYCRKGILKNLLVLHKAHCIMDLRNKIMFPVISLKMAKTKNHLYVWLSALFHFDMQKWQKLCEV